jgi:hypothetical protein
MENKNSNEPKVSSVVRVILYNELLAQAIRTLAHPAHVHEMGRQLDIAMEDFKVNVGGYMIEAMDYFDGGMLADQMNRKTYLSNAAIMRIRRGRKS